MFNKFKQRLINEYNNIKKEKFTNIFLNIKDDDYYKWYGYFIGPFDTPYYNGIFKFTINIPDIYPFKSPLIKFETYIYHPNIIDGFINFETFNEWTPIYKIKDYITYVYSLFYIENIKINYPLNNISILFIENINLFKETAEKYTKEKIDKIIIID